jgi:superfamily II DNA or RNA helicase/diadenosine tetraphosphate (Ap4A) HIT family hydrolase/HKD family nuclease
VSIFLDVPESEWVARNELAFAIRDSFAVSEGHTLVVPHRLVATWWDATRDEQHAILDLVEQVKRGLDETHQPDGYNVGFNAGAAAGQTIQHLHVHVIPRYDGDVPDPRGGIRHVMPGKGNYLASADASPTATELVTPLSGRMYRDLRRCLDTVDYDRVDLLISFVMRSGVNLIAARIDDAIARGARIRLLSTDYLLVTDVGALGFFLDRIGVRASGGSLEARVYSDPSVSFHPKAYVFTNGSTSEGEALVGSSNLSHSGLRTGVEWNLRSSNVGELVTGFDRLWDDRRSIPLTVDWLADYQQRKALVADKRVEHKDTLVADEQPEPTIAPWSVQREALSALEATRLEGHRAGLVVMATGLGKTWLAAFDATRPAVRRTLFVAHREEILSAARDVFRRVRPDGTLTMFIGDDQHASGDVVFASIQSLQRNLHRFAADEFDYIVIDEFHHAAAPTYRRTIGHFTPTFMLGLTATPDRTDAADLLALCADNLVYECGLTAGLHRELLSPFRYRAIKDVADYEHIPWRSGRFDVAALAERLETQQRAQQVFEEWRHLNGSGRRSLAFCCSITHADFMAAYFVERGARAVSVHTAGSSVDRHDSLDALETGELDVVFSVDLFNEGVDVPAVDIVMMLRPTESPIVFFQQLGRGLRRVDGKTHLDVVDLVGNHRSFLLKARLLATLAGRAHLTDREAVAALPTLTDLPDGCSIEVETEALDLLERLLGAPRREDRLAELARTWADDHGGERPRALELALLTNTSHELKRQGGWFGFMRALGMLSEAECKVHDLAGDFLVDIEHGSYTKSYKLVTLRALLSLGTISEGSPLHEVAVNSRWQIFRDPRLLADLTDATSQFDDVRNPTDAEWSAYWLKNPINALAGPSSTARKWFHVVDRRLVLQLDVPAESDATFQAMLAEIVEYRLHRYLMGRAATRVGQRCQPRTDGGRLIDAAFVIETTLGQPISVLFESAGGSSADGPKRNPEYVEGVDVVLARLRDLGATVLDAYVDSGRTRDLPIPDRRLSPDGESFPIDLRQCDLDALRRQLLRQMSKVGREPTATSGGNSRKAMRLLLGGLDQVGPKEVFTALTGDASASPGAAQQSEPITNEA